MRSWNIRFRRLRWVLSNEIALKWFHYCRFRQMFNKLMFFHHFLNPASASIRSNSTENNWFDVFQSSDQHSKHCRSFPDSHLAGNVIVVTNVTIRERRSRGAGGGGDDDCGSVLFNRWRWLAGVLPRFLLLMLLLFPWSSDKGTHKFEPRCDLKLQKCLPTWPLYQAVGPCLCYSFISVVTLGITKWRGGLGEIVVSKVLFKYLHFCEGFDLLNQHIF